MNEMPTPIAEEFDRSAGAAFGFAGLLSTATEGVPADRALLLWLLSSHALAAGRTEGGAVEWLEDYVRQLSVYSHRLGFAIRESLRNSWAAWMPILLLSSVADRDSAWDKHGAAFSPCSEEQGAVRRLLIQLVSRHGRCLFDATHLPEPESDGSPQQNVVLRLGQTVKDLLTEEAAESTKTMLAGWRETLLGVRRQLPDRISRGVAPEWPLFEDFLLSCLHVADWLLEPDVQRVPSIIADCAKRPDERLTDDQLSLSASLFGWIRGYRKIAGFVRKGPLRTVLAQQSMSIVARSRGLDVEGLRLEASIFYATAEGSHAAFRRFVDVVEIRRGETVEVRQFLDQTGLWQSESSREVIINETADLRVAQSLLLVLQV
ncbi:MAG: hypothetical protein H8E35_04520 [Ardenticatenia bacterium]|nr:hypothetical protein [Ardenticatenia bacterium]